MNLATVVEFYNPCPRMNLAAVCALRACMHRAVYTTHLTKPTPAVPVCQVCCWGWCSSACIGFVALRGWCVHFGTCKLFGVQKAAEMLCVSSSQRPARIRDVNRWLCVWSYPRGVTCVGHHVLRVTLQSATCHVFFGS
jgi:hypothetical protein